jgi:hypothetical protein
MPESIYTPPRPPLPHPTAQPTIASSPRADSLREARAVAAELGGAAAATAKQLHQRWQGRTRRERKPAQITRFDLVLFRLLAGGSLLFGAGVLVALIAVAVIIAHVVNAISGDISSVTNQISGVTGQLSGGSGF